MAMKFTTVTTQVDTAKSYIAELEAMTKALVVNLRQKRSTAVLLT